MPRARWIPLGLLLSSVVALSLLVWQWATEPSEVQVAPYPSLSPSESAVVNGASSNAAGESGRELVVGFRPGMSPSVGAIEEIIGVPPVRYSEDIHAALVHIPDDRSVDRAIEALRGLPEVAYVEPNLTLEVAIVPNDPLYGPTQAWYYDVIKAPAAWDVQQGKPSVIVAVIDTGIDLQHEDLQGRIWVNANEVAGNGLDDDNNGCIDDVNGCRFQGDAPSTGDVNDDHGHGTLMSGIIAATGNNGVGMAGVAWGVTIMPVKVVSTDGTGTTFDVANGIVYAARNGARVINLSITRTSPSQVLEEAIAKVVSDFDVVIVAAAGNGSLPNPSYPAAYPEVVAVGATARSDPDRRADFSNWGPLIDVVAPGVDICGTTRGNQYACTRGTSTSAALVSGLAALVFSRYPDVGANEVRQIIRLTAVNLPEAGSPRWDGWGRIDMHQALTKPLYHSISPSASRDGPQ